ncbi:MAG: DUF58 domain-containing protein [Chloroflexi bacterium]|nr:DUF58 domain-containing protein [Chloroflexota bacterium]
MNEAWQGNIVVALLRKLVVPLAFFLLLLLGALLNDSWLLYRAAYVLGLAALFGLVWIRLNRITGVKAHFETAANQIQAGDELEVTVSLRNFSALPRLWLEITLPWTANGMISANGHGPRRPATTGKARQPGNHTGQEATFARVFSMRAFDDRDWSFHTAPLRRGIYDLGPLTVTSSDPFRLQRRSGQLADAREILVYPRTEDLPLFDVYLEQKTSQHRSRASWDFFSFQAAGVRPHTYGDSLRHVHWPSTARTGKLMVKVLEASTSSQSWLVLDMQQYSHSPDGTSEEQLVSAAASVGKLLVQAGLTVGLLYYDGQRSSLAPSRGTDHLWDMLRSLARARASGQTPLSELVRGEMQLLGSSLSTIFFTPSASPELLRTFQEMKHRGWPIRVVLVDSNNAGSDMPEMEAGLRRENIPVYRLAPGMPLAAALVDGVVASEAKQSRQGALNTGVG